MQRFDSSTFAFWSKSPVDIEPRRIRLQSNSYTTNTLLDTVTAATIQVFKEFIPSVMTIDSAYFFDELATASFILGNISGKDIRFLYFCKVALGKD